MTALVAILAVCLVVLVLGGIAFGALLHAWASHDCYGDEASDRISDTAAEMLLVDAEAGA